ncbi:mannose-ethanolamine phosphotransferase gpi13 [Glugoides intestinalis]
MLKQSTNASTKSIVLCFSFGIISAILFLTTIFKLPETTNDRTSTPLGSPKFKKLIYLIVDGLRFDGFIPTEKQGDYYNNFTFTKNTEILKNTFLSVASIPTATTCRVTSMMTGAPSNLVEELATFFASNVSIESLPEKFADRKMMFYGDDMWVKSFKVLKNRSYSFCGLSKDGIVEKELDLMEKVLNDDSDIKFVHTISLDAFGHKYGINHFELKDAQYRADKLITDFYNNMDDDTLLIVTSDHGVTDSGAHGGTSRYEMASVCGFYSKKPLTDIKEMEKSCFYNKKFIERLYDVEVANTAEDWIKATNPYQVIHQDDILPTLCYLMGISAPANTYGNLIPYLVDDLKAYEILYKQKQLLMDKIVESGDVISKNYEMSILIYEKTVKRKIILSIISMTIGIASLTMLGLFVGGVYSSITFIIVTVWVSHSYWAFASEDLIWAAAFLLKNFSIPNVIFVGFYLKTPGRTFFKKDRLPLNVKSFGSKLEAILLMIAFLVFKLKRCKGNEIIKNTIRIFPQLAYLLYSQLSTVNFESKILFLTTNPCLDSLFVVHMPPAISVTFIYFIRNLDVTDKQENKHILLSFAPYLVNLEKVQQSLNYEIFFSLTDKFSIFAAFIAAFAYIILPRLYILRRFSTNRQGLFLCLFSLFFCLICSWVMYESLVFQYFFVGRLLFTTLFFFADLLLEMLLLLIKY